MAGHGVEVQALQCVDAGILRESEGTTRCGAAGRVGTEAQTARNGIGASLCLEFYCVVGLCQPL